MVGDVDTTKEAVMGRVGYRCGAGQFTGDLHGRAYSQYYGDLLPTLWQTMVHAERGLLMKGVPHRIYPDFQG